MAEERRLTGEDAKLMRGSFGTEVVADGTATTIAADTWVLITAKTNGASDLFKNLNVGDFYYNNHTAATTPASLPVGNRWKVFTPTDMLDMSGWSVEITKDKIDVTTTADGTRKYRNGKADAVGTASFVLIKGVTDVPGGLMSSMFRIVEVPNGADSIPTVTAINTEPYFLLGYLDYTDEVSGHHKLATLMQVEFEGFPLNFRMNEASNVELNFHLTGSTDIVIYRLENA